MALPEETEMGQVTSVVEGHDVEGVTEMLRARRCQLLRSSRGRLASRRQMLSAVTSSRDIRQPTAGPSPSRRRLVTWRGEHRPVQGGAEGTEERVLALHTEVTTSALAKLAREFDESAPHVTVTTSWCPTH